MSDGSAGDEEQLGLFTVGISVDELVMLRSLLDQARQAAREAETQAAKACECIKALEAR